MANFGRIASGFKSFMKSPLGAVKRGYGSGMSDISKALERKTIDRQTLKLMAHGSMKTLGTTAALTYGYRALRRASGGPGIFQDRKGKRDIVPFVPFI